AAEAVRLLQLRPLAEVLRPAARLPGLHGHAQRPAARRLALPPGRGGARDAARPLAPAGARHGRLLHLAALRPQRHRLAPPAPGRQRRLRGRPLLHGRHARRDRAPGRHPHPRRFARPRLRRALAVAGRVPAGGAGDPKGRPPHDQGLPRHLALRRRAATAARPHPPPRRRPLRRPSGDARRGPAHAFLRRRLQGGPGRARREPRRLHPQGLPQVHPPHPEGGRALPKRDRAARLRHGLHALRTRARRHEGHCPRRAGRRGARPARRAAHPHGRTARKGFGV
ncbi:MAG: Zn-dependent hydrolase, partial [uncultured Acetobacteraceae bacterium]